MSFQPSVHTGSTPEDKAEVIAREFEKFAYIVSHDLSAPLRHVREFTRLLIGSRNALNEEESELIDSVFFRIAVPEINEPLTQESVRRMRAELTSKKGDPAGTDNSGAAPRRV